jgi:hypothetical protein
MKLASVRDGDIVEVNDGLSYLAIVTARNGRRLVVEPIGGKFRPVPVKPPDVVGHWRKVRPRASSPTGDEAPRGRPTEAAGR